MVNGRFYRLKADEACAVAEPVEAPARPPLGPLLNLGGEVNLL